MPQPFLEPSWPAPSRVRAAVTMRAGGASSGAYASFNLADHVGDLPAAVAENRRRLAQMLGLPAEPRWLRQMHGNKVATADSNQGVEADAAVAGRPGSVCAVLTADCLPVLLAGRQGDRVGVAHAGWRGLARGVVEATIAALGDRPQDLLAWLGPAIGPEAFEVGDEVRNRFVSADPDTSACFRRGREGRWLGDLYGLARQRLAAAGVVAVFGGGFCTMTERERFFSYRRDGATGRMAALIWLD